MPWVALVRLNYVSFTKYTYIHPTCLDIYSKLLTLQLWSTCTLDRLHWIGIVLAVLISREDTLTSWRANWCHSRWGREKVEESPDAFLSGSEWTGIYYLSPLPTITFVMSWFNSLGKQAYSSHVSINVNYPGSWLCLTVPQHCRTGLIAPACNPIC